MGATSWTSGRLGLRESVTGASARSRSSSGSKETDAGYGRGGLPWEHHCERLLSEGYHVVCMDYLRTGSLENAAHLEGEAHFEYADHAITSHLRCWWGAR